jgi:hypothetical protein
MEPLFSYRLNKHKSFSSLDHPLAEGAFATGCAGYSCRAAWAEFAGCSGLVGDLAGFPARRAGLTATKLNSGSTGSRQCSKDTLRVGCAGRTGKKQRAEYAENDEATPVAGFRPVAERPGYELPSFLKKEW